MVLAPAAAPLEPPPVLEPAGSEVRSESERFGFNFFCEDAIIFNSFIHDTGLIDLPMGGRHFTWVNKVGSKMSKLHRFLISDDVLHTNTDLKVVALDRLWSNHNLIPLHCKKNDFGPIPFKIFNSWFDRIAFKDMVKEKWDAISDLEQSKPLYSKLKDLKSHLKLWSLKRLRLIIKNCILATLPDLDKKIDDGYTIDVDMTTRINRMQELEDLEKPESMDIVQKSRVK
ncbi:hypothetical protein Tco_0907316 [Tanacetum coccineum]|uniref:RNA-directed DNA polymerase, eukaryota, reverse transcriptase zinc-binding domain protein n=1 Tax=Tanacetum coccineum TaxID=301880 RepID=A0ABQ5CIW7_9ASTR